MTSAATERLYRLEFAIPGITFDATVVWKPMPFRDYADALRFAKRAAEINRALRVLSVRRIRG